MDLIVAFALFIAAMITALAAGITLVFPMILGLTVFFIVALRRGSGARALFGMILSGMRRSLTVVVIMLLIGALTSLWRQCGTIACFTYYGVRIIPPRLFILSAFLLSAGMSYALGTAFGTCSAVGVILMTIALANGISPVITGGAVMSGIYFGDRGSPTSSSASLVANESQTDLTRNIRLMLKECVVPLLICTLLYAALSLFYHSAGSNSSMLDLFPKEFDLSLWCLLPTIVLLVLAFSGVRIRNAMMIDILLSFILTMVLQRVTFSEVLIRTFTGYTPRNAELTSVLAGGGIASMLQVIALLLLSNGCAGIFRGTGMLSSVETLFSTLTKKLGRFPAMVIASLISCLVFCNQTIGIVMCKQCMGGNYLDTPEDHTALMLDLEDSVITIAALIPCCIACSVPMTMLGCEYSALVFAFYLYLMPLWHFIRVRSTQERAV